MQEAIYDLGEIVQSKASGLTPYIKPIKHNNKKGQPLNVLKINFDTKNKKINFDVLEQINNKTTDKYLFIGRVGGPNNLQFCSSSTTISNHISQTFIALFEKLDNCQLKTTIKEILQDFYLDTKMSQARYRYLLKVELIDNNLRKTEEIIKDISEGKKRIETITKTINEYLKKNNSMGLKDFGLFVIYIDGEGLHVKKEYKDLLNTYLDPTVLNSIKKSSSQSTAECSFCGKRGILNDKLKAFSIKYYTTNLKIYASNFKNYDKTLVLCPECEKKITIGQKYLRNHLSTTLAYLNLFILPNFLFDKPLDLDDLDEFSKHINNTFKLIKSYEDIQKARQTLKEMKNYYTEKRFFFNLDLIFYKLGQQDTKILKTIKDVDPDIFFLIEESLENAHVKNELLKNNSNRVSLESLLYILPIKSSEKEKNKPVNYKYLLGLYEKIFKLIKIDEKELIKNFLNLLGAIHHERTEFFGTRGNTNLQKKITQQIKFLLFLKNLNLTGEEDFMDVNTLNLNDNFKEYLSTLNYDEQKTALFLIGYLIGEIGKKESSRTEDRRKPILNKLSYKGADLYKIKKLSLTIFNKLRQEDILRYNEAIYSEFRRLFDKNESIWQLSDYENEFYILSGYAYSNMYKTNKPQAEEKEEEEGGKKNEQQ